MSYEEQLVCCSSMNREGCVYVYTGHLGRAAVLVGKGLLGEKESAPWTLWAMPYQSPLSRLSTCWLPLQHGEHGCWLLRCRILKEWKGRCSYRVVTCAS